MTQAGPIARPKSRIWLLPAFLLIIAGFTVGNLVVFVSTRKIQATNRTIAENALVSIEEVGRIVHDIDQERLLIDAHIFESTPKEMEPIEGQLHDVEADMAKMANVYEPLTTYSGEHEIWQNLWREIGDLREPIKNVLELSRRNEDVQALARMRILEKRFALINQEADGLIAVNRREANRTVAEIEALQLRSLIVLGAITAGGAALALFLAWWVMRVVRRQDDQIAHDAHLMENRNRELDAFAGRVAHDLRAPLSNISLSAGGLSEEIRDRDRLAILHRSVARMEAIIQDLLALSRIDENLSGAVAQTKRIERLLEEELLAKVKSVDGSLKMNVEPARVRCSETLLHQALWNIGENSAKYRRTEVQLELDIQGRVMPRFYEFRISDNASGMAPDELRHVFEPFFRATNVRSTPGSGLGLSIVKRIIEASGGTILVTSEPGRGTTFVIRLPLAPEEALDSVPA